MIIIWPHIAPPLASISIKVGIVERVAWLGDGNAPVIIYNYIYRLNRSKQAYHNLERGNLVKGDCFCGTIKIY